MKSYWRFSTIGILAAGFFQCLGVAHAGEASSSLVAGGDATTATVEKPPAIRVYSHLLVPSEHPDYTRRAAKPPGWELFDNQTEFITLRSFSVQGGNITDIGKALDLYTVKNDLGRVIWPSYPILFAKNLGSLADEIKRRNLYLFDIWGYVPGSGPGGYWQQYKPPADVFPMLEAKLGDRWLGADIGEQDSRYIARFSAMMTPTSTSRFDQYLNFQRHFERMGDDLGNRISVLTTLNLGHYLLKEGNCTMIGAETAQGLPNPQLYYSFIRGAGKEYGVPWFGNVSVYNRWGNKSYTDGNPAAGTSLSLMKRLMYSHILYNCMAVGFENGWFYKDNTLSPIGNIQKSALEWVKKHGQPGVLHTPVAMLLDFDAGWLVPRSACYPAPYRVWGNLPYENKDYLTDDIANMFYPGYADSSFFHDESGFSTQTPYGDGLDCLLDDAPLWALNQYGVVVVTGTDRGPELRDKLQAYVAAGGHLVLTGDAWIKEQGKGRVTVLPGTGLVKTGDKAPPGREDVHFESPRPLSPEAHEILDRVFKEQRLFEVDPRLGLITCRKKAGEYTLGVLNNTWGELPLSIISHCGQITSVQELTMDTSERSAVGFLPPGLKPAQLGNSSTGTIAGGDVRIFSVRVKETGVDDFPHIAPPPRPSGVILPLRKPVGGIKEEILRRPTFFQHFDGVMVDWRYLHNRDAGVLAEETPWIKRQGLRVMVDLSSGMNLYPDLRLIDNDHAEYEKSKTIIADVMAKMEIVGATDLLLSLNGLPENNYGGGWQGYGTGLKWLSDEAAKHGITLYMRMAPNKTPGSNPQGMEQFLASLQVPNIKVGAATAETDSTVFDANTRAGVGLLLASAPCQDPMAGAWTIYGRISGTPGAQHVRDLMAALPGVPVVLDGVYENRDQEYLDAAEVDVVPQASQAVTNNDKQR